MLLESGDSTLVGNGIFYNDSFVHVDKRSYTVFAAIQTSKDRSIRAMRSSFLEIMLLVLSAQVSLGYA